MKFTNLTTEEVYSLISDHLLQNKTNPLHIMHMHHITALQLKQDGYIVEFIDAWSSQCGYWIHFN